MDLRVQFCASISNPFVYDVWGVGVLTRKMVDSADPNPENWNPNTDTRPWTLQQHAGRVKYLARAGWNDAILIDVGAPVLNYYKQTILDGNHRIAAAIYLRHKWIAADVQGQLSVCKRFARQ